ncbi:DUF3021 domain-containing protein [Glutamicibacter sp. NPDC087344]|uniref:DUF3021 domain-containing protein n=1 Tax=Glutamicibacter sp. NPDC087344 TaxID=3363994 RepID=UPI00381B22ED
MSPLRLGLILTGAPLLIMGAIGLALYFQGDVSNARSTFAVGVIIAAVSGTSVLYQVNQWSLKRQSLIHFGIMLVTVLPALYFSGWFSLNRPMDYFWVLGIFLMVGAVLWLLLYLIFGVLQPKLRTRPRG